MIYPITDLNSWPLDSLGHPVLKSTSEAVSYAQLIYNDTDKQACLPYYRKELYLEIKSESEKTQPNFDYMMELACKAQFYRECLEECLRIMDDKYSIPHTAPPSKGG